MYKLHITKHAKKQLGELSQRNKKLYVEVIDTMERLRLGQWKGGTRVKKLRGYEDLYEARLNSGDRMLFIFNTDNIHIHYMYVIHDEVNLRARNSSFGISDSIAIDSLTATEKKEDFEIPEEQVYRLFSSFDDTRFQVIEEDDLLRLLETEAPSSLPLKVKLLPEQEKILYTPLPLLLSGGAGSGKSTVSIYRLMLEAEQLLQYNPTARFLYFTESERLVGEIREQFLHLCHERDNGQAIVAATDFHSFRSLMTPYNSDRYVRFLNESGFVAEFFNLQRGNHRFRKLDVRLVYQEIISVIGSLGMPENHHLSKSEYMTMPKHEAPLFYEERELIWGIHEWYISLKQSKSYCDINDLIYNALNHGDLSRYDFLVGDEIQDFSFGKILLTLELLKPDRKGAFLFAGDAKQILTESHFSWAGLKRQLQDHLNSYDIHEENLLVNFRNPNPIARLGESLFTMQKQFGIKGYTPQDVHSPLNGVEAMHLHGDEESILKVLSNQGDGQTVIIVPNEETEIRLKEMCHTSNLAIPLVLMPFEAKGLEFDEVWMWNMSESYKYRWHKLKQIDGPLDQKESLFILTEIRKLYVALTRALQNVYIFEPFENRFWSEQNIHPIRFFETVDVEHLLNEKNNSGSPGSIDGIWVKHAMDFFDMEQYDRCIECLDRLDLEDNVELNRLKQLSQAHLLMRNGEFDEAGALFRFLEEYDYAVSAYDHAGRFDEIAFTLNDAAFTEGITTSRGQHYAKERDMFKVRALDRIGNYRGAGLLCLQRKHYREAIHRFEKAGLEDRLEECFIELLDDNSNDTQILEKARIFFSRTKNHVRHAQALKLIKS